jgi:hypothetical protein
MLPFANSTTNDAHNQIHELGGILELQKLLGKLSHPLKLVGAYSAVTLFNSFFVERLQRTRSMQRETSTKQRGAPGQDTGRSQSHLSSYLAGGAPGQRHRTICKTDGK